MVAHDPSKKWQTRPIIFHGKTKKTLRQNKNAVEKNKKPTAKVIIPGINLNILTKLKKIIQQPWEESFIEFQRPLAWVVFRIRGEVNFCITFAET